MPTYVLLKDAQYTVKLKAADGSLVRAQVPKYFGLEDSDLPAIAIHEGANDGKYFFKNAAVKKVEKWLNDFEVSSHVRCPESDSHNSLLAAHLTGEHAVPLVHLPSLILGHVCCQAGKVPKFIKSEETPKDNNGPVKVVTANTFEEVIFGGKDVLIEFYAPWCGHCKSLAPIYEQVHPISSFAASVHMLLYLVYL